MLMKGMKEPEIAGHLDRDVACLGGYVNMRAEVRNYVAARRVRPGRRREDVEEKGKDGARRQDTARAKADDPKVRAVIPSS